MGYLVIVLREFIEALLEAEAPVEEPKLDPLIVDFLIEAYAEKGSPSLRWVTGDLKNLSRMSRFRMVGGLHVEWQRVAAFYNHNNHILVVNTTAAGDLRKKVLDVLHEIQHYNQHVLWDTGGPKFRKSFTKGKKLPPDVNDDPILLYDPPDRISILDIIEFWERRYGYEKSPHEVDARAFAERYIDEAMGAIQEHLGPED